MICALHYLSWSGVFESFAFLGSHACMHLVLNLLASPPDCSSSSSFRVQQATTLLLLPESNSSQESRWYHRKQILLLLRFTFFSLQERLSGLGVYFKVCNERPTDTPAGCTGSKLPEGVLRSFYSDWLLGWEFSTRLLHLSTSGTSVFPFPDDPT